MVRAVGGRRHGVHDHGGRQTGDVTLDQVRAVVHDDPADPDEPGASAATLAANLVTLTATITDGDGDTDTAVANIGGAFQFEDDGPSIIRRRRRCRRWRLTRPTLRRMRLRRLRACSRRAFGNDGFKDADNNDVADADAISYALGVDAGAPAVWSTR